MEWTAWFAFSRFAGRAGSMQALQHYFAAGASNVRTMADGGEPWYTIDSRPRLTEGPFGIRCSPGTVITKVGDRARLTCGAVSVCIAPNLFEESRLAASLPPSARH